MSGTKRFGARRAIMIRPRKKDGFPVAGLLWISFYHEPGSKILPLDIRIRLRFRFGATEIWREHGRTVRGGRILDVHLRTDAEPSLGNVALETGARVRDIPSFLIELPGGETLLYELDSRPDGLEYWLKQRETSA